MFRFAFHSFQCNFSLQIARPRDIFLPSNWSILLFIFLEWFEITNSFSKICERIHSICMRMSISPCISSNVSSLFSKRTKRPRDIYSPVKQCNVSFQNAPNDLATFILPSNWSILLFIFLEWLKLLIPFQNAMDSFS